MPVAKRKIEPAPLPGENTESNPRAVIGGNAPPPEEQVRVDFHEGMLAKHSTYEQRVADLLAAAERAVVNDQDSAGKAGDLIKSINAMGKAVDEVHSTVKKPYFEAGKVVDGLKNALANRLQSAKRIAADKQTEFLREEEAKREAARREAAAVAHAEAERAAEAERQRLAAENAGDLEALAEVEVVAAPAVVPKAPEPIRSADTGTVVSGRKEWQSQVLDYEVAAIQVLDDDKVKEAIDACVKRRVRAGIRNIEGVRIWQAVVARTY